MTDHPFIDLLRIGVAGLALWLAVLVLRLAWGNRHAWNPEKPHPLTYLSFATLLTLAAAMRIVKVGEDPTWDLWIAMVAVGMGTYGVLKRTRLARRVPHRNR